MRLFICIIVTVFSVIVLSDVASAQAPQNNNERRELLDERTGFSFVFGNIRIRSTDGRERTIQLEPVGTEASGASRIFRYAYQTVPFEVHPDDTLLLMNLDVTFVSALTPKQLKQVSNNVGTVMLGDCMADIVGADDPRMAEEDAYVVGSREIWVTTRTLSSHNSSGPLRSLSSSESNDTLYSLRAGTDLTRPLAKAVQRAGSTTVRVRFYPLVHPTQLVPDEYAVVPRGVDRYTGNVRQIEVRTGMLRTIESEPPIEKPSTGPLPLPQVE